MVVDQSGGAGADGVQGAHQGGGSYSGCIEGPIQPPLHHFQDFHEVPGWARRWRHAACQSGIQVGVRTYVSRQDETTGEVNDLMISRWRLLVNTDNSTITDFHVAPSDTAHPRIDQCRIR